MDLSGFRMVVDQTINGLVIGNIYALLAVGLALIFGAAHLINFAHGSVFMAGAYTGWLLITKLHRPFVLSLLLAGMVSAVIGVGIEMIGVRPFQNKARVAPLLATLGLSIILDHVAQILFGPYTQAFPSVFPAERIRIGGVTVGWLDLVIATLCLSMTAALFVFLKYAKTGKAIRASALDAEAAMQMGINVNFTNQLAFALASFLGGMGGVLVGIYYNNISPTMGFQASMKGFTACVLGGLGSIPGAIAGGLLLGLIESWGVGLFGAMYRNLFTFALLLLVLFLKPNGIFSRSKVILPEPLTGTFVPNLKPLRVSPVVSLIGLLLAILFPFLVKNPYVLQLFTNVWTYAILAVSLTIVAGTVGITSLGHAGLLALGAYASAILTKKAGLPFTISLLSAGIITAIIGTVLVLPSFRLKGHYVALATLGVGEIINHIILSWEGLTGGPAGISNIAPPTLFGFELVTPTAFYWLSLGLLTISVFLIRQVASSSIGRTLRAIREDDVAARSFAIQSDHYKALAYAISGGVAGWGGALTAHMYSYINNETYGSSLSILGLTAVILGGLGNIAGAILGTFVLILTPELLRGLTEWRWIFYGVVLILVLRFRPQGLLGSQ